MVRDDIVVVVACESSPQLHVRNVKHAEAMIFLEGIKLAKDLGISNVMRLKLIVKCL